MSVQILFLLHYFSLEHQFFSFVGKHEINFDDYQESKSMGLNFIKVWKTRSKPHAIVEVTNATLLVKNAQIG